MHQDANHCIHDVVSDLAATTSNLIQISDQLSCRFSTGIIPINCQDNQPLSSLQHRTSIQSIDDKVVDNDETWSGLCEMIGSKEIPTAFFLCEQFIEDATM
jgi:hypothetical protein